MEIEDRIYGLEQIEEPILIELIRCPSVQRLKDISQLGMPDNYYWRKGFSRYEHSLGVMILLRRLGANLEEQVAGLLHDVSHTTFSHLIDWIKGDPTKEDYQDKNHFNIIKNSELSKILDKYGYSYKEISDVKKFGLLEKPAPSLCADRIDYCLRELSINESKRKAKKIFKNLLAVKNQIAFKNLKSAKNFAKVYSFFQKISWGGDQSRARYILLSDALKKALSLKIILFEDLEKTESYVLNILENSRDPYILEKLTILKRGFNLLSYEKGFELKTKFRYIDPEILTKNGFMKLSDFSSEYKKFLEFEKEKSKLIKRVKIIPLLK
jgi:hypothetical protein